MFLSDPEYLLACHIPEPADIFVGEAEALRRIERVDIADMLLQLILRPDNIAYLLKEEHIYLCCVAYHAHIRAPAQQLRYRIDAVVRAVLNVGEHLILGEAVEFLHIEVIDAYLERAGGLEQALLHRPADAHHLARGFHLSGELIIG